MMLKHGIDNFSGLKYIHVIIDGYSHLARIVSVKDDTVLVELNSGEKVEVLKTRTFR